DVMCGVRGAPRRSITAIAIAGTAPTRTIAGKQNQSGRSDRPLGPKYIQSWTQPSPKLPNQIASGNTGKKRNLQSYPGMTVAKAAVAAVMPVASAASCSITYRHSDAFEIKSARGETTITTSAT